MQTQPHHEVMVLEVIVRRSVTVLPRILQVLSRRGITLETLQTTYLGADTAVLQMSVVAPLKWHGSIAGLITKLVDVQKVTGPGAPLYV